MQEFAKGSYEPVAFFSKDDEIICFECASKTQRNELDIIGMDSTWNYQPKCNKCNKKLAVEVK